MSQSYQADTDKLLTELNNGVLTISFNRPEAMNALHPEMLTGIGALVDQASADDSCCGGSHERPVPTEPAGARYRRSPGERVGH